MLPNGRMASPEDARIILEILKLFSFPPLPIGNEITGLLEIPQLDEASIDRIRDDLTHASVHSALQHIITYFSQSLTTYQVFLDHPLPEALPFIPMMAYIQWMGHSNSMDVIRQFKQLFALLLLLEPPHKAFVPFCVSSAISGFKSITELPIPVDPFIEVFGIFPVELFETAAIVLSSSIGSRDRESIIALIKVLTESIVCNRAKFQDYNFAAICTPLDALFKACDLSAVEFAIALSTTKYDDSLNEVISVLPLALFKIPVVNDHWPLVIENIISRIDAGEVDEFEYVEDDELEQNPHPPLVSDYISGESVEDILSLQYHEIIEALISILDQIRPSYRSAILDNLVHLLDTIVDDEHYVDFWICFAVIASRARFQRLIDVLLTVMTKEPVFTPGISFFNSCDDFAVVNYLRQRIVLAFLQHSREQLPEFLQSLVKHPFLFVEVIVRIHARCSDFDMICFGTDQSINAITSTVQSLSRLCHHCDAVVRAKARQAKLEIGGFFVTICRHLTSAMQCFAHPDFLAMIFDPLLHDSMFALICTHLQYSDRDCYELILKTTRSLIEFLTTSWSLYESRNANLVLDNVLELVNSLISHSPDLSRHVHDEITAVTALAIAHSSQQHLAGLLQAYTRMLWFDCEAKLTRDSVARIVEAIRASTRQTFSDDIRIALRRMLARSTSADICSMFTVREPLIFLPFFTLAQTDEDTKWILNFISCLCSSFPHNTIMCHRGEVDLLLLESIRHFPNGFRYRNYPIDFRLDESELQRLVFPLLLKIASVGCSYQVVTRWISLAIPGSDGTYPAFARSVIDHLIEEIMRLVRTPQTVIPLGYSDCTLHCTVQASQIRDGFTFDCWLFYDEYAAFSANESIILLSIEDTENQKFTVSIQNKWIGWSYCTPNELVRSLCWRILDVEWTRFIMSVSSEGIATPEQNPQLRRFWNPCDGPLTIAIGGLHENQEIVADGSDTRYLGYSLGPFRFVAKPLSSASISQTGELSVGMYDDSEPSLFALPKQGQIPIKAVARKTREYPNMIECFGHDRIVPLLIPFFLCISEMPSQFLEAFTHAFQWIMRIFPKELSPLSCYDVIGHLLSKCPPDRLTYDLYLHFFGILEMPSESLVITSICKHVLLNLEIWYAADGATLLRVVTHWFQSLFPAAQDVMKSQLAFSRLMALMRMYFWYEPMEDIIRGSPNSERPRGDTVDVSACRNCLYRLAFELSARPDFPTEEDLRALVYSCCCPDSKQVISFLGFFVSLARQRHDPIRLSDSICEMLCNRLHPHDEQHFALSIEILDLVSDLSFHHYLHFILHMLTQSFLTQDLFDRCMELLPRSPAIYPLCALLALNLDDFQASRVVGVLSRIPIEAKLAARITQNELWAIWLLALLLALPLEESVFVIEFMLNVVLSPGTDSLTNLNRIFDLFDLLIFQTSYAIEYLSKCFLNRAAQRIFDEQHSLLYAMITDHCLKGLLLYVHEPDTAFLSACFAHSPFQFSQPQPLQQPLKITSFDGIRSCFCHEVQTNPYRFGFKLTESGESLYPGLFNITNALLRQVNSSDPMIDFWRQRFQLWSQPRREADVPLQNHRIGTINSMALEYYRTTTEMNQLRELRAIISHSYGQCGVLSPNLVPSEAEQAAHGVRGLMQLSEKDDAKSARQLHRLLKSSVDELSPWRENRFSESIKKRIFQYCMEYSQPLIKRSRIRRPSDTLFPRDFGDNAPDGDPCRLIKIGQDIPAVFSEKENELMIMTPKRRTIVAKSGLKRILKRTRFRTHFALEIFTKQQKSYLLDFGDRTSHLSQIAAFFAIYGSSDFTSRPYTRQWLDSKLSNFEYLMIVNAYAGRSFHDATIYPIFPWVLRSYETELNLFRDFSLPIAAQSGRQNIPYAAAQSTPATIAYFLSRCLPFSSLNVPNPIAHRFTSMATAFSFATSAQTCIELCPEFFFGAEYFGDDFELPRWATNPDEFVYLHRKALESRYVSENLHQWIDLIFGVASRGQRAAKCRNVFKKQLLSQEPKASDPSVNHTGCLPPLLFPDDHPRRTVLPPRASAAQRVIVPDTTPEQLHCAHIFQSTDSVVSVVAISVSGSVFRFSADWAAGCLREQTTCGSIPIHNSLFAPYNAGVVAINEAIGSIYLARQELKVVTITAYATPSSIPLERAEHIATAKGIVVVTDRNGRIFTITVSPHPDWRLLTCITADYLCAVAVSTAFATVAVGTHDGRIVLVSLTDRSVRCVFDVGEPARRILITPGWGFVLVETAGKLFLFSPNGTRLRTVDIDFVICEATTWKCECGFDFVAVATSRKDIRIFEAFYLRNLETAFTTKERVIAMKYIVASRVLVIVTVSGKIIALPWNLPDF
jgi:hypothetical protein